MVVQLLHQKKSNVFVLPIARVKDFVTISAKSSVDHLADKVVAFSKNSTRRLMSVGYNS